MKPRFFRRLVVYTESRYGTDGYASAGNGRPSNQPVGSVDSWQEHVLHIVVYKNMPPEKTHGSFYKFGLAKSNSLA